MIKKINDFVPNIVISKADDIDIEELINSLVLSFCDKNFHSKSMKEDICLEKECDLYKQISCAQCFEKHNNIHKRFNIRVIIEFILRNFKQISNNYQIFKDEMPSYSELNHWIDKINEKMKELEIIKNEIKEIIKLCDDALNEIKEKYQKILNNTKIIINQPNNEDDIISLIDNLLKNVEKNDNNIILSDNKMIFQELELLMKEKISETKSLLTINPSSLLIKTIDGNQIEPSSIQSIDQDFSFDSENHGNDIQIQNKTQATKLKNNGYNQAICFCQPALFSNSKIGFKIDTCDWIAIGICRSMYIKKNQYSFSYSKKCFERGCYLISNNGYSWSDCDENDHNKQTAFKFQTNDQIEINYDIKNSELMFLKNGIDFKILKFQYPIEDTYVFCVVLHNMDDSLKII